MTRVKICGITDTGDALAAVAAGADALGFVFAPGPRQVSVEKAAEIISALPPLVTTVGVFVDASAEDIRQTTAVCGLGAVQLHGNESPVICRELSPLRVIKAFRVAAEGDLRPLSEYTGCAHLLDSRIEGLAGGSGKAFAWGLAAGAAAISSCLILAGGLNPGNVSEAIASVRPWAVDVSSGVESSPGIKDAKLIKEFVAEVKKISA
ncbi:MAG: phosphoribosylanthranilate isomerase [bacterium]|nr:phosphoribosylanthranilate isomerase [bacterium]MDD4557499.1 phosphoribosylanthranilate isomerase [bacterium]